MDDITALQQMDALRRGSHTRELVTEVKSKEVLDEEWIRRLERLERMFEKFSQSQEFVLPRAFAELIERVKKLEQIDITPAEPAELQQEINDMGRALADMSAAVINHIATLQKRLDACESRFTDLPQVLNDLQTQRRVTR
jgi:type IV secretory pathway VirB4 component